MRNVPEANLINAVKKIRLTTPAPTMKRDCGRSGIDCLQYRSSIRGQHPKQLAHGSARGMSGGNLQGAVSSRCWLDGPRRSGYGRRARAANRLQVSLSSTFAQSCTVVHSRAQSCMMPKKRLPTKSFATFFRCQPFCLIGWRYQSQR